VAALETRLSLFKTRYLNVILIVLVISCMAHESGCVVVVFLASQRPYGVSFYINPTGVMACGHMLDQAIFELRYTASEP